MGTSGPGGPDVLADTPSDISWSPVTLVCWAHSPGVAGQGSGSRGCAGVRGLGFAMCLRGRAVREDVRMRQ
jgi:hypothetical protein